MAPNSRQPDDDRAKKTLYVTGFNSKLIKRHLLKELFCQGGPVVDVTLFETHAYILFQHAESVPYCLALFHDIEIFGDKLKLKPRCHTSGNPYTYLDYLTSVRNTLREDYARVEPPSLPAKKYSKGLRNDKLNTNNRDKRRSMSRRTQGRKINHINDNNQKHSSEMSMKQCSKGDKAERSTPNSKRKKRGGKRKNMSSKKIQKKVKYLL